MHFLTLRIQDFSIAIYWSTYLDQNLSSTYIQCLLCIGIWKHINYRYTIFVLYAETRAKSDSSDVVLLDENFNILINRFLVSSPYKNNFEKCFLPFFNRLKKGVKIKFSWQNVNIENNIYCFGKLEWLD